VATNVTVAPVVNVALQFVPQFTAIGLEVTVPLPFPDLLIERIKVANVSVALQASTEGESPALLKALTR
jgi:hypothetical protein